MYAILIEYSGKIACNFKQEFTVPSKKNKAVPGTKCGFFLVKKNNYGKKHFHTFYCISVNKLSLLIFII
jgi:hypothetical protein